MRRFAIAALAFASACFGRDFEPSQEQISRHREAVYAYARGYILETFNVQVLDEGKFNPVRFNSQGVWGTFDARLKELGGDRFEVRGWVNAEGNAEAQTAWSVIVRLPLEDPEAWRYRRIDETVDLGPEFLGWKFGAYHSVGYRAEYSSEYLARVFER